MARVCHKHRLPWIALVAMVGLMSVAGNAGACEAKRTSDATPSCCVGRSTAACGGCCGTIEGRSTPKVDGRSVVQAESGTALVPPQSACQCRSGEPAGPTPKPESRPFHTRFDQDRNSTDVAFMHVEHSAIRFLSRLQGRLDLRQTPIYLRTSHLLI